MSYWIREIAGWVLVVIGLAVFVMVYNLLLGKRVVEAWPLAFVGFVVFRGGIHLLKVALAARAATEMPHTPTPGGKRPLASSHFRTGIADRAKELARKPH